MVELDQLSCIGILLLIVPSSISQGICDSAPTPALRITCQQITNWDANTRNIPLTTRTSVSSPGPAGLAVGAVSVSAVASSTSPTTANECMDIACLCGFFGGSGGSNCVLANGQTLTKAIRKEYRVLTDDERQRYHTAMWTIKGNGDYDTLSRIHSQFSTSPGAHSGPAFLPWHREYIKRLEIALRRVDPTVALPYWDSTLDSAIPLPKDSVLWGNELMGSQDTGGAVRTGAFRNWPSVDGSRVFARSVGTTGNLLYERDITTLLGTRDIYQILAFTAPQSGCPNPAGWTALEYVHGGPHVFTGGGLECHFWRSWSSVPRVLFKGVLGEGAFLACQSSSFGFRTQDQLQISCTSYAYTSSAPEQSDPGEFYMHIVDTYEDFISKGRGDMLITTSSTNDPLFFNHHSMIDLIWEQWRLAQQSRSERETVYPPESATCSSGAHFANTTMAPFFPMLNLEGLSNAYTDNLYEFAPRPTCTSSNPNGCGSKYLFCDLSHGPPRCSSKIMVGGNCGGYTNNEDRCYLGQCINNICAVTPTPMPTTQPPIVTTTPAAPTQETCFNEQQCCSRWASRGECSRNPSYMNLWCKASCRICTPTSYSLSTECSNRNTRCNSWASRGECRNNPSWMSENCRLACNLCGSTRAQICGAGSTSSTTTTTTTTTTSTTTTTMAPMNSACMNQHYCCIAWASRGYCTASNQRAYMAQYCQAACSFCSGSPFGSTWNTQACSNGSPSCASWRARGQCNANRAYMWENCRQSCGACSIGILSTRLSSCGFSRRWKSLRQPVSEFRTSPQSLPLLRKSMLLSRRPVTLEPAPRKLWLERSRETKWSSKKANRLYAHGPHHKTTKLTKHRGPSFAQPQHLVSNGPARPIGRSVPPRRYSALGIHM